MKHKANISKVTRLYEKDDQYLTGDYRGSIINNYTRDIALEGHYSDTSDLRSGCPH